MRALVIDDTIRAEVAEVVAWAETHRLDRRAHARMIEAMTAAGDDPHRRVIIPMGYRCAFTIEEQPMGWSRHLSVSVDRPGKLPSPESVAMIMQLFGFSPQFVEAVGDSAAYRAPANAAVYLEQERAINLVEKL